MRLEFLRYFALSLLFVAALASPHAASAAGTCPAESFTTPVEVALTGEISDIYIDSSCQYLYAANKTANRVEVYALQTKTLLPPIPVGSSPTSLDASPDGRTLYVANFGEASISVIDTSQRMETRKVDVPLDAYNLQSPASLAVASNGQVFFSAGSSGNSGGTMRQYNPTTGSVTERQDYANGGQAMAGTKLRASGDRRVIGITAGGAVRFYDTLTNSFARVTNISRGITQIALDRTGNVTLAQTGVGGGSNVDLTFVIDSRPSSNPYPYFTGTITGAGSSPGLHPDGKIGYRIGQDNVDILDIATFQAIASVSAPGAKRNGPLAVSSDGSLLAVTTAKGFTILPPTGGQSASSLRTMTLSTAQTRALSFFRFYNSGTQPGAVKVVLYSVASGEKVAEWRSPIIPPGTAPQFSVREIEAAALPPSNKPFYYQAVIRAAVEEDLPAMTGTFAHIVWSPSDNILTNVSTCDANVAAIPDRLVNVHSSVLDDAYPSFVSIMNTGTESIASLRLGIYDAKSGSKLGSYVYPKAIPPGAGDVVRVALIEQGAHITPAAGTDHYVVKSETQFTGYLQHLVNNLRAGVLTDMSTVCKLPQS